MPQGILIVGPARGHRDREEPPVMSTTPAYGIGTYQGLTVAGPVVGVVNDLVTIKVERVTGASGRTYPAPLSSVTLPVTDCDLYR